MEHVLPLGAPLLLSCEAGESFGGATDSAYRFPQIQLEPGLYVPRWIVQLPR